MNGMHYDEYSSSTEISSQENLKINHEMRDFAKRNNMENFFKYSSIVYDYDVE